MKTAVAVAVSTKLFRNLTNFCSLVLLGKPGCWIAMPNRAVPETTLVLANILENCKSHCFSDPSCTGIEFDSSTNQCLLVATGYLTLSSGTTHFDLNRNC